ncbi:hypothetical protein LEP1GSC016_2255 [Leptospira borgpetersenii serovar Hardjo-bovis str. Sponselee]|uniref:Uncharacterized protein n=1 Tax=Leptospira borgpetersenii serovar Hardjo-bovis str. Sponselee TaxID=1303729 RepID=M6C6Y8_LEPBO|nr:hypothetical protein D1609_02685 [Leptospira borgpetersenii serovar Hardjo-bovis]EMJ82005.1 hypothetical protein LEP1GSC016_2255 [Leptospira borgpetersenii serovar Hardjo-bovis str. Sponselee]
MRQIFIFLSERFGASFFIFFCLFQKMEYSVHRKIILKNHNVIFVGSKWESLIHDRSKSGFFFRLFESETRTMRSKSKF